MPTGLNTRLNHPPRVSMDPNNAPVNAPIYQTSTFDRTPSKPLNEQFSYSRSSNPTLRQLELSLSEIQEREDCLVMGSGMAAIASVMLSFLKSGDHLIFFQESYKAGRVLLRELLPRLGITHTMLSHRRLQELEDAYLPGRTQVIFFETPSNPSLSILDLGRVIRFAKEKGLISVLDGTYAGLHQHTRADVDLVIQSLTKFAAGHSDVIAGSVAGSKSLIDRIRSTATLLGATLDPHAAYLIQRGLKTYAIRYERECANAEKVALFLQKHPAVERVFYPGLPEHPGHALASQQMSQMGAVVTFALRDRKPAARVLSELKLFHHAVSLGATESLACACEEWFGEDLTASEREEVGITPGSVRLSVGLEDPDDLIADLDRALLRI